MRAFKVMPKALRILAKKLTHLACNSRHISVLVAPKRTRIRFGAEFCTLRTTDTVFMVAPAAQSTTE